IRVSLGTVRHPRRFKIVVIDIQITLKQMLRDFIGIRVNRAKKSGMVNITSSVNSRERSGINTIFHELNPLFTINVTMRDIKHKNHRTEEAREDTLERRKIRRGRVTGRRCKKEKQKLPPTASSQQSPPINGLLEIVITRPINPSSKPRWESSCCIRSAPV